MTTRLGNLMDLHGRGGAALAVGAALAMACLVIAAPGHTQSVNIEEIFWCNAGEPTGEQSEEECIAAREAILDNCTSCHAFVPIVKAQKTEDEWRSFLRAHRERVDMSDEDYAQIEAFLIEHFNPENPVPELPPELEQFGMPPA